MPVHLLCKTLGMTRDRFEFLVRHFHVHDRGDVIIADDGEDLDDDEDAELVTIGLDRVGREQESVTIEETEQEGSEAEMKKREVWFEKLCSVIDHVRSVSQTIKFTLGTILSLDEMMIRFFGRSLETHHMKNKPIRKGYKLFVLATKNGYIINFTPDGRTANVRGEQETDNDKLKDKIESMIMYVRPVILDLKYVQQN